jgi:Tfp pilus assembly protein FimT
LLPVNSSLCRVKERGFTVIELIMIIVLISIMAAVAVPKFGDYYNGITVGSAATKVAADIRFAQNRATTTQDRSRHRVVDATHYEVLYCPDSGTNFDSATCSCTVAWAYATDPTSQGNFQVDLSTEFPGVVITSPPGHCIEFNSLGVPYYNANCTDPASCGASAGATVVIQADGTSKTITVTAETGVVSY